MLLSNKAVFIVEDNVQNRVVFQMSLVRHGATVDFERWGPDAICQLNRLLRVDVIVLDLMLADHASGFDVFDQIRAVPRYERVPIVAVSAMDPAIALPRAKAKGFAGFIAKPIDGHLFPKQLAEIIEGKQVWYAGEQRQIV